MEQKETLEAVETKEVTAESVDFQFETVLNEIYQDFKIMDEHVDAGLDARLKELLTHTENELTSEEYMKLMYMEGLKYEQQENKNAARFCAMRMLKIKECYENPKKKRPRFLDMIPYTIPEEMLEFIERYTDFLEDTYNFISKRLLLITAGVVVIILLIFILVLKLNFLMSLINAALIGLLNYILQKRRLPDMFQKNQTAAIEHYVEDDVLEFDRPVRYS